MDASAQMADDFLKYLSNDMGSDYMLDPDVVLDSPADKPSSPFSTSDSQITPESPLDEFNDFNLDAAIFDNIEPLSQDQLNLIAQTMAPVANNVIIKQEPVHEILADPSVSSAEPEVKTKRPRKKRKLSDNSSEDIPIKEEDDINDDFSNINLHEDPDQKLSREELLNLSSKKFEEYVRRFMAKRDLTSEERRELKRQRRLIKNRESAQASRQRKKNYVETLEQQVATLNGENNRLREHITALSTENKNLKDEVIYLHDMIKKTPGLSTLFTAGANYMASFSKGQQNLSANVKSAGLCLMILLFSFGLFFNNMQPQQQQALPWDRTGPEPIPEVIIFLMQKKKKKNNFSIIVPSPHRVHYPKLDSQVVPSSNRLSKLEDSNFRLAGNDRDLLNVLSEQEFNTERLERAFKPRHVPKEARVTEVAPVTPEAQPAPQLNNNNAAQHTESQGVKRKRSELKESKPLDDVKSQISSWKPNTTYLMCNDIQQVTPPENVPRDANSPLLIAFLLPSDSFNGTSPQSAPGHENNGMLEVTCQVIDVNILPQLPNSQSSSQSAVKSSA